MARGREGEQETFRGKGLLASTVYLSVLSKILPEAHITFVIK